MSLFDELKRRSVIRIAIAYVVSAWLIIQVVETIFPAFGFGDAAVRIVVIALAIGFLPAIILAWVFELTPEGLKKEGALDRSLPVSRQAGKKLDRVIMLVLVLGLAFFAFDKFVLDPARDETKMETARQQGRSEALVKSYGEQSIAVLPFVNVSSDPEQEYFSDGISEEMLNLLARIPELRVISRSSSFAFKGKEIDLSEISEKLRVAHILEGSVRKAGNRIRITAQLIDARSDTHLWSQTYDRTMDDVFAIQDEIAADVVKNLRFTLLEPAPRVRQTHPQAYALTLQAKNIGPDRAKEAAALLEQALALDPEYVPALTELSSRYFDLYEEGVYTLADSRRLADIALDKALAIDPYDGLANAYRGWDMVERETDYEGASKFFELAFQSDPGNAEVVSVVGKFARWIGRHDEAIRLYQHAADHDPLCFECLYHLSKVYMEAGRLEEAETARRKYMALGVGGVYTFGQMLLLKGDPKAALEVFGDREGLSESHRLTGKAMALHDLGRYEESDAALAELIEQWGEDHPRYVAEVYAWNGDLDDAFEWLKKAYTPNIYPFYRTIFNPVWRNLHGDSRWDDLRERAGVSAERLAAVEFELSWPESSHSN